MHYLYGYAFHLWILFQLSSSSFDNHPFSHFSEHPPPPPFVPCVSLTFSTFSAFSECLSLFLEALLISFRCIHSFCFFLNFISHHMRVLFTFRCLLYWYSHMFFRSQCEPFFPCQLWVFPTLKGYSHFAYGAWWLIAFICLWLVKGFHL